MHGEAVFAVFQEAEKGAAPKTAPDKGWKGIAPPKGAKSAPRPAMAKKALPPLRPCHGNSHCKARLKKPVKRQGARRQTLGAMRFTGESCHVRASAKSCLPAQAQGFFPRVRARGVSAKTANSRARARARVGVCNFFVFAGRPGLLYRAAKAFPCPCAPASQGRPLCVPWLAFAGIVRASMPAPCPASLRGVWRVLRVAGALPSGGKGSRFGLRGASPKGG